MTEPSESIMMRLDPGRPLPENVTDALNELAVAIATFESAGSDDDVAGFGFADFRIGRGALRPGPSTGTGTGPFDPGKQDFCLNFTESSNGETSCTIDWT